MWWKLKKYWPRISFFFSSRRRHTRWTGDWSSDVCSSDLACDGGRGQRFELSLALDGRQQDQRVADRGRLGRNRRKALCGDARALRLDRSGRDWVRQRGQRCGPRFEHRLAADQAFELLLELLLVEQLAAREPIDLPSPVGDAVLIR